MGNLDKQTGYRLKIARKSCNYKTALDFCKVAGIPKSTYSQHENGNRSLTTELLLKYSDLLEIEPNWLLTGMGHPCPLSKNAENRKNLINKEVKVYQDKNLLPVARNPQINVGDMYAIINIALFKQILLITFEIFKKNNVSLEIGELIDFCIDIYNHVEILDASANEKESLIKFSANSILKGRTVIFDKKVSNI